MKKLFLPVLTVIALSAVAQPKGTKANPILVPGYYVSSRGDTVRGEVQTNPEDPTELYHKFGFKTAKGKLVALIDSKRAKAYGFDGMDYVLIPDGGEDVYVQRLCSGRLNFFEYRFSNRINSKDVIESSYYIQDTGSSDPQLKAIKKLSKTYKKDLEPYMKDQVIIWTDLNKFRFDRQATIDAIKEFNKHY